MKFKLDFSKNTAAERISYIEEILGENEDKYLSTYLSEHLQAHPGTGGQLSDSNYVVKSIEGLANYILYAKDNKPAKGASEPPSIELPRKNQSFANKKRIASLEETLDNEGEQNMRTLDSGKSPYRNPKPSITKADLAKYPEIAELRKGIEYLEARNQHPKGTLLHYRMRHMFIDMRKEQYAIKDILHKPIRFLSVLRGSTGDIDYSHNTTRNGVLISENRIDFENPLHIYYLFTHYSSLRQVCADKPHANIRYVLDWLEDVVDEANLSPARQWVVNRKVDGASNGQIRDELHAEFGLNYETNYISVVFKQEICEKVAFTARLMNDRWMAKHDPSAWKVCSTCGERKLRDEREFVRKLAAYDGLSSRCKVCDKRRRGEKTNV